MHADREYRTALIKVQVRRAFEAAIKRAGAATPPPEWPSGM